MLQTKSLQPYRGKYRSRYPEGKALALKRQDNSDNEHTTSDAYESDIDNANFFVPVMCMHMT